MPDPYYSAAAVNSFCAIFSAGPGSTNRMGLGPPYIRVRPVPKIRKQKQTLSEIIRNMGLFAYLVKPLHIIR